MAGPKIDAGRLQMYLLKRSDGVTISESARQAGISRATASRIERGEYSSPEYRKAKAIHDELHPKGVVADDGLSAEARRARDDFAYFRLRYLGQHSEPWAVDAANTVAKLLESPNKEWLVVNLPPGIGKSTFWTIGLPLWLIVRNRGVRIMIGSAAETGAKAYVQAIRRELERPDPIEADDDDRRKHGMVDAEATLIDDFGGFKPGRGESWTDGRFVVTQKDGVKKRKKEATVAAYGRDSRFLGYRCDFIIWDDLVDEKGLNTAEKREQAVDWWKKYAESRLEPGGLMVLQGQRLHAEDLYRKVLDIEVSDYGDDDDELLVPTGTRKKYQHVVYKAHYDEYCQGVHAPKKAVPFDPGDPTGSGCLLNPKRLTWRDLASIRDDDPRTYLVSYQQEDVDPASVLVPLEWVNGGRNPETSEEYPGCWDKDRIMGEIPKGLTAPWLSIVCADPSPSKFWSIQWWLYHLPTERRFLIEHARQSMGANDFLDLISGTTEYVGLLEDWWAKSMKTSAPITHVIVERNAAQRFLLQYDFVKNWQRTRKVRIIAHDTYTNKSDPTYGVQATLPQQYRFGRVSLPSGDSTSKGRSMALVNEVTRWPESSTDDCVMSQWFGEFNVPRLRREVERPATPPKQARPSWLSGARSILG